jgi:hypothetical protein
MLRYIVGLHLASFEIVALALTAYSALDVAPFLKALHRDMTFDAGLSGLTRK